MEDQAVVKPVSEVRAVSDRTAQNTSTTSPTAPARNVAQPSEPTQHIVELRVAIYNNKPQVLEGARRGVTPVSDGQGGRNWGTPKDVMDKLDFINEEYLEDFEMVLMSKTLRFDLNIPEQAFRLNFLRTQPCVANSESEITDTTSHVIWDEVTEAIEANKSFDHLFQAFGYIKEMSEAQKAQFCRLFAVNTYRISPDLVMRKLTDKASSDPKAFCLAYEDQNKTTKMFLLELIEHQIVRTEKQAYFFGEIILGANESLAIDYLKDPNNNDVKVALTNALLSKRS